MKLKKIGILYVCQFCTIHIQSMFCYHCEKKIQMKNIFKVGPYLKLHFCESVTFGMSRKSRLF